MIRSTACQHHVGGLQIEPGRVHVRGWVFHPKLPLDRVSIEIGGRLLAADVPLLDRPDVASAFPAEPMSLRSGFTVDVAADVEVASPADVRLAITPHFGATALTTIQAIYCDHARDAALRPQPPFHLMQRVGGAENYVQVGVQALSLILTHIAGAGPIEQAERVLDWGCGSGRIAGHLSKFIDADRIHGCDIDREAVKWAQENLHGPHFAAVDAYPPTQYPDGYFDRIYGISVMTHLDEDAQLQWLGELRRISRPGAGILLSVIGERLRATNMPASVADQYARSGFATFVPAYEADLGFRDFSPAEYYK